MSVLRTIVPLLLLSAGLVSAEPAVAPALPWSDSFTMVLREQPRTFVVRNGISYLVLQPEDAKDPAFLAGKDICLLGKFERTDGLRAYFFALPGIVADGQLEWWSTRVEGDNLYVFATASMVGTIVQLQVTDVAAGESDSQIIAGKLAGLTADDWDARMGLAAWARLQADVQGNKDWWQNTADTLIAQAAHDAAEKAAESHDLALLVRAFGWAIDDCKDATLAARVASRLWVDGVPESDALGKRLRAAGFDRYKGDWRQLGESLALQFDDRYNAVAWRDAEAYFQLGRWAELHIDDLPRARDRSFTCWQAGYRADPNHSGIRRKLNLGENGGSNASTAGVDGPFQHAASGVLIGGPEGWTRSKKPIDGLATWTDPESDTAYVSIALASSEEAAQPFTVVWNTALLPWSVRPNYNAGTIQPATAPTGTAQRIGFSYLEGTTQRNGELIVIHQTELKVVVTLVACFEGKDRDRATAALMSCLSRVTIVDPKAKPVIKSGTNPAPSATAPSPAPPAAEPIPDAAPAPKPAPAAAPPVPHEPIPGDL